ncbi:sodium-dependent transporter [Anaerococcus vaginimassiliensis]|uniref:sodium-dependent transporter n=1 Tax=Anaerococcus vaginimassiliensis TaxID=2042308 RepID=UPI001031BAED|nr:sodium-dependent transporter [Anaerococcus vaginimassiliensis]
MNKFSSRLGFILTAVGSAVGMANVWGFPYKLQEGGLFFLIAYIFFISLFSYVGLSSEFAIGRIAETGTIGSYEKAFESKNKNKKIGMCISILPLFGLVLLTIGYAVVVSYIFKALVDSATGTLMTNDVSIWYEDLSNKDFSVWPFHLAVIILTLINCLGSAKTLEKSSKFMMPAFFILFLVIAIKILTLPNALEGYKYMFRLDYDHLNIETLVSAMGQAFFSLSITGSAMMICGAYLHKDEDIIYSSKMTGLLDTIAAMVAALVMIPSVIVFSMDQAGGPGLLFQVLPTILQNIEGGRFFAIILYLAVLFAGISSLQIMFEVLVESLDYKFEKLNRKVVLFALALFVFIVGINIEKISLWGPFMDIISIYIIPIGAMIGAVTWYYILDKKTLVDEINSGASKKYGDTWYNIGKYIYTPLVIIICILTIFM